MSKIAFKTVLLASAAVAFLPALAQAGFEWRGPLTAPVQSKAPVARAQDGMSGLEPVIMWNDGAAPVMPAQRVETVETAPMSLVTPPADDPADMLTGFGSDLPLAVALQQVVPASYQVSFGPEVDPGASVSWEGGKSWKRVLSDMLSAKGLGYRLKDNVVVVGRFAMEEAAPMAPKAAQIPPNMAMPMASSQVDVEPMALTPAAKTEKKKTKKSANTRWSGSKGQSLRSVLKDWSATAEVELFWSIDYDYRLPDDVGYSGPYEEAVGQLLDKFAASSPQPYGQLHQGQGGPKVLIVKTYGDVK